MSKYMEYVCQKIKNVKCEEDCVRQLGDDSRADDLLLEIEELECMLIECEYPRMSLDN